jgi:hypothetical protein
VKTALICHDEAALDRQGLAGWLASFSDLVGIVAIREDGARLKQRVAKELRRSGWLRFADVLAFRLYYRLALAAGDRRWERRALQGLTARYGGARQVPVLITGSPNSAEARQFLRDRAPELVIARCKTLLTEEIFMIPPRGTFVLHPGICPEYRNAHGCFWALANGDLDRVGMTLLQIDRGVDTGPVYATFSYPYDARRESHAVIQARVVLENLDRLADKLDEIYAGRALPIDTTGRASRSWGQPWLTKYLAWRTRAWLS